MQTAIGIVCLVSVALVIVYGAILVGACLWDYASAAWRWLRGY